MVTRTLFNNVVQRSILTRIDARDGVARQERRPTPSVAMGQQHFAKREENQRVPTRTAAAPRAFGCGVFGSMEGPNLVTFENNQTSSFWKAL
jgi:hypothetical protein